MNVAVVCTNATSTNSADEVLTIIKQSPDIERPDGETQVQTIPKQVLRIQRQPREQIAEVPIVLHFEQLVENPQLYLRMPLRRFTAWMSSMSTKNVPRVMEVIGEIVGSITRARLKAHC